MAVHAGTRPLHPPRASSGRASTPSARSPAIVYAASYLAAIHQDFRAKRLLVSRGPTVVAHKLACIRLVNAILSGQTECIDSLDILMFLLTNLLIEEPTVAMLEREDMLHPFSPHNPTVFSVDVFGQCQTDQMHCHAVVICWDVLFMDEPAASFDQYEPVNGTQNGSVRSSTTR
ncbi:hypothetical protein LTR53_001028 [Teratosphaeriaceae sp. CCFEE 6253]|nr:hypothetical protein LTR53_001028 [Teratosphaeriaceae sp. CCFEE 6253]